MMHVAVYLSVTWYRHLPRVSLQPLILARPLPLHLSFLQVFLVSLSEIPILAPPKVSFLFFFLVVLASFA